MKNLRERCESLCFDLGGPTSMCPSVHGPYVDKLEAFARKIRNEALEEAASILDGELLIDVPHPDETKIGVARRAVSNAAKVIRAAALAANVSEEKA